VFFIVCLQCEVVTGPKHEIGEESSHAMIVTCVCNVVRGALLEPCCQRILANTGLCLLAPLHLHEEKCWLMVEWVRRMKKGL
jgi:hypothetical protein